MKALLIVGITLLLPSYCFASLTAIDNNISLEKLHRLLQQDNDDPTAFSVLNQLAQKYTTRSIEKAYEFNSQSFVLAKKIDDKKYLAESLVTLAKIQEKDFISSDKILYNYQLALSLFPDNAIKERIDILNEIGEIYRENGYFQKALIYFSHSFNLIETNPYQFLPEKLQTTVQISTTSYAAKEFEKALEYAARAKELVQIYTHLKTDFVEFQLNVLHGDIYLAQGEIEEARTFFSMALAKDLNRIHPDLVGELFFAVGDLGVIEKNYGQAENFYKKSLQTGLESNNHYTQIKALRSLAKLNLIQNDFDKCLDYSSRVINHCYIPMAKTELMEIYAILYQLYEKTRQYERALNYHKKFKTISDSLSIEKNSLEFNINASELKAKEQEAKIDLLNIKQHVQKNKITLLSIVSIVGIVLLIGIVYLLFKYKMANQALKEKFAEIKAARNEALKASKTKQDFLSVMSHEIRTPMNAVLGLTNILKDESPREDQLIHLNHLQYSAKNLLFIINNILDFSKAETGKLELVNEQFILRELLDNIVNSLRYSRDKKDLTIKQNQQIGALRSKIIGDPVRLNQILVNLIGNAIKFTPKGHVILHSKILELNPKRVKIQFDIEDTGIGIPEHKIDSIFESFTQVTQTHDRQFEGSGLGLAITKKLVSLHSGQILVRSTAGKGSTFTVILSFDLGDAIGAKHNSDTSPSIFRSGIEGKRILLVEDNKINQMVAKKILAKFKTKTTIAENGAQCLKYLDEDDFDIVLMDIHMPIMDGIEATQKIREMEGPKGNIPIIGLSADAYSEAIQKATAAGMNDYLSKPFKPEDLFEALLKATKSSGNERLQPRRSRG